VNESMTAIVEYQVRAETTSPEQWLETWQKRADDALEGEPETGAYAAAVNIEDDSNVLVYERYEHGHASLKLHIDRPAHSTLTATMGERRMTKRRVMSTLFTDIDNYGWWCRPESASPSQAGIILAVLGFRFDSRAQEASYLELTRSHAGYTWDNEPNTLIYSAGRATADADREIDVIAGDLVFVMGCTDMASVDKHANDPVHLALGPKFTEVGINPEPTFMRLYQTTGNGYLWRS